MIPRRSEIKDRVPGNIALNASQTQYQLQDALKQIMGPEEAVLVVVSIDGTVSIRVYPSDELSPKQIEVLDSYFTGLLKGGSVNLYGPAEDLGGAVLAYLVDSSWEHIREVLEGKSWEERPFKLVLDRKPSLYPDTQRHIIVVDSKGQAMKALTNVLKSLKELGDIGHSTFIEIDGKSVAGFDGDGNDRIRKILIDGKSISSLARKIAARYKLAGDWTWADVEKELRQLQKMGELAEGSIDERTAKQLAGMKTYDMLPNAFGEWFALAYDRELRSGLYETASDVKYGWRRVLEGYEEGATDFQLKSRINVAKKATEEYLDDVGAAIAEAAPARLTYQGFKIENPDRMPEERLRQVFDKIDWLVAFFKKKGLLELLQETLAKIELMMREDKTAAGRYFYNEKTIVLYKSGLREHSGRLWKDWVQEVFIHEIGHHIHTYLHPEAWAVWTAPWKEVKKKEQIRGSVSGKDRQRFFNLLKVNNFSPGAAAKKLKGLDKVKFAQWLRRGFTTNPLITPKTFKPTKTGLATFEFLRDPIGYFRRENPEGTEKEWAAWAEVKKNRVFDNLGLGEWASKDMPLSLDILEELRRVDPSVEKAVEALEGPSDYGRTNAQEDFAETFVVFMTEPSKLSPTARFRMQQALAISGLYGKPVGRFATVKTVALRARIAARPKIPTLWYENENGDRYGLDDGYPPYSPEWDKSGTLCSMCENRTDVWDWLLNKPRVTTTSRVASRYKHSLQYGRDAYCYRSTGECAENGPAKLAARYKNKKKVKKQDGKGTTTVYEYSDRQVALRNNEKAKRIEALSKKVAKLRKQLFKDLSSEDPKKALAALAVGLIDETYERVGNDDSAQKGRYGVTGWQRKHISFNNNKAKIEYVGKSGVKQEKIVSDPALVKALRKAYDDVGEGTSVFAPESDKVEASDVNDYLQAFGVTAKDLRGLHANDVMRGQLKAVRNGELPTDPKERKKVFKAEFKAALEATAAIVGHEPSTLRSQYLVPGLEGSYLKDGTILTRLDKKASSRCPECGSEDILQYPSGEYECQSCGADWYQGETDDDKYPLKKLSKSLTWGGDTYWCPLQEDTFVHFTTRSRAEQVLASGKLLMRPPYEKFGGDAVYAVSTVFGKIVPGTQTSHTRAPREDPLVAVRYAARVIQIDGPWVDKMRKDFLTLMKNIPRVKDYETAIRLKKAFTYWNNDFEALFFQRFLNKSLKYDHALSDSVRSYLDEKLRKSGWDLHIEIVDMPINRADDYWSPEARFHQYKQEVRQWEKRVRRKAQVFWKVVRDAIDFYEHNIHKAPDQPPSLQVKVPVEEQTVLEGFRVVIKDFENDEEYHRESLEKLKTGLKIYRKNATERLPLLLKMQLPVILDFELQLGKGGTYTHNGTITLYASSLVSKGPFWASHVMAHEMGHHLWRTYLPEGAKDFWRTAIKGDYGDLDLQYLVDNWPGTAWAYQFSEILGEKDPILALQVEAISQDDELQSKEDFQRLLNRGQKTIRVPKTPISGYAQKNPQEAFCEAIGLLVTYGPRAVHEKVRGWLNVVLPGQVKLAGLTKRVAGAKIVSESGGASMVESSPVKISDQDMVVYDPKHKPGRMVARMAARYAPDIVGR